MVKWVMVTKNKKFGDLGVGRIRTMNECLLLKWWWRFRAENQSLWKEVICRKYNIGGGRWIPSLEGRGSKLWSDIISLVLSKPDLHNFYHNNSVIVLGDGMRAHFWLDKWAGNVCLKEEFPRLFSLSIDKLGVVNAYFQRRGEAER
ncbi:hypothetical protein CsSME_00046990 [Camellia sinensis var. sinensis]